MAPNPRPKLLREADYVARRERDASRSGRAQTKSGGAQSFNRLMSTEEFGAPGRIRPTIPWFVVCSCIAN